MGLSELSMIQGWAHEYAQSPFALPGDVVTDVYARRVKGGFVIDLAVWRVGVIGAMSVSPYFSQGAEAGLDEDCYERDAVGYLAGMLGGENWHEREWSDTTRVW